MHVRFKKLVFAAGLVFLLSFGAGYWLGQLQVIIQSSNILNSTAVNSPDEGAFVKKEIKPAGYHYSFFNNKEFFEEAFRGLKNVDVQPHAEIRALTLNHHLLAKQMIAQILNYVKSDEAKTVVLLSPNHFNRGAAEILLSAYDWKTPYGRLEADQDIIDRFLTDGRFQVDESPFQEEHGVTGIVGFIKKVLPRAKIIPIIIKDSLTSEESEYLAEQLRVNLPKDALVIGSFDFSHYLPKYAADFHDQTSFGVLNGLDVNSAWRLDIDSRPGLAVLMKWADLVGAKDVIPINHSSSDVILGNPDSRDNTSYINVLFSEGESTFDARPTVLAFGDIMLDRFVNKALEKKGLNYAFAKIERFLTGSDITLANLEGPVTDFSPRPLNPDNTTFTFNPEFIWPLKQLGFNLFSLANNHTHDFGKKGLEQTHDYLEKADMDWFGDPGNASGRIFIKEIRRMKIGFVGYSELKNNNFENVLAEVKDLRSKVDWLIVMPHWGIEYQKNFSKWQKEKAHKLIDVGADVILGSHPHVVQPMELYKNKLIFYSLGNFLFDQTFSIQTQEGLGVGLVFGRAGTQFYLFPHENVKFQVDLMSADKRQRRLDDLAERSVGEEGFKKMIREGQGVVGL